MWALCLLVLLPLAGGDVFTLGYLTGSQRAPGDIEYVRPGLTISGAISLAVEEVNNGTFGKKGHRLEFVVAETYGEELLSIRHTASLWSNVNVSGYIGPQETCVTEARMAAAFNLPMISYFCADYETSDKRRFPTFARTRPPDTQISKSVLSVLLAFNWTQVAFMYLNSSESEFSKIGLTILSSLKTAAITVRSVQCWDVPYHHGYGENPFAHMVRQTYHDARIYVVLGHHYEHLGLLVAMEEMHLFDKGQYWVVGVDIEHYNPAEPENYLHGFLLEERDPVAIRAYRSYLGVVPSPPVGFKRFSDLVNSYMEKPPFNFPNPLTTLGAAKTIRAEAAYLYDAVKLYANTVLEVIDLGIDPRNGVELIRHMAGKHYHSAMGYRVYMDENCDAEGNYTLLARFPHRQDPEDYGLYPVGMFIFEEDGTSIPELQLIDEINWVNGRPPIAEPPCGFNGEKCINHTGEITGGIAGGLMLVLSVAGLILYRNWRYEQELDSLLWKLDYSDIQINDQNNIANGLGTKISRAIHPLIRTSQVSLSSNPDSEFRYSTIYTQVGVYKGRVFGIKKVKRRHVDITREMKKELKMLRDLRHDNLNAFIGACTDPPNICIVTEYCTRGSLKDILENEDVKLDNMFIASLIGDILRGVMYLHESPVRVHGNLKMSNCLVDSRWVVKVADFGLQEFKKEDYGVNFENLTETQHTASKYEGLLYRAPELLRSISSLHPQHGTRKGDVYSFGIILYELHARHGPFGEPGLTPIEILYKVMHPEPGQLPFRPQLDLLEQSFDFVRDCVVACWSENPDDRPDFKTVCARLRPLRKGMKPNILDNMMAMMEKYANNLEALVDERTDQLLEEKKKTEALLYEMLPRTVAEQLKRGHKVEAESFDCVTIYFSDIVGFTSMSAESTPLEVVDFLNDLYTCFDSTIENYDVYKVETIGDAYMVVSGLPIRNGIQHAGEIASMSIHLLDAVKRFRVRHRPTDNLMLRIGIHSGPVCAGVVGLKMPRYCLFGDTVNTASRMESTGSPLKVHCSEDCKALLDKLGGYSLTERGLVCMKGKGEQRTYWLLGEDPAARALRAEERMTRRTKLRSSIVKYRQLPDANGYPCRSSLKVRPNITRCASLESPKRLRFELGGGNLESIADSSPRKSPTLPPIMGPVLSKRLEARCGSSSCPCIEDCMSVNRQLKVPLFPGSVPVLFPGRDLQAVTISAPASPCYSITLNVSADNSFIGDELHKPLLMGLPESPSGRETPL